MRFATLIPVNKTCEGILALITFHSYNKRFKSNSLLVTHSSSFENYFDNALMPFFISTCCYCLFHLSTQSHENYVVNGLLNNCISKTVGFYSDILSYGFSLIYFSCETSIRASMNLKIAVATLPCTSFTRRTAAPSIIDTLVCIYTSRALFANTICKLSKTRSGVDVNTRYT